MSKEHRTTGLLLTVLCLLVVICSGKDWQGTGTMTESNMTVVNALITNNPITSSFTAAQTDAVAQTISTALNSLWDPAWNVVIVKSVQPYDSIVYGYAYKDHWMWINGVAIPSSTNTLAYIIWKDYNCNRWSLVSALTTSSFTSAELSAIQTAVGGQVPTTFNSSVWMGAHAIVETLENDSTNFHNGGFTIVASQYPYPTYSGYICLLGSKFQMRNAYIPLAFPMYTGSYLLFQTRAGTS